MSVTMDPTAVTELAGRFSGVLVRPEAPAYDEVRRIHNGMIDKRPALIARCLGTADVADTIALARRCGLEVSVRGGGHNVAGHAVTDGGVMLDLSLMKGIQVDPARRTVRAQGGVTWRELNRETQAHGLAVTGGVISTTGIAGLTLGGGLGWLMGKHGLALDNLVAAEVVTASGEILRASRDDNPDLFWGVRGGGGNFGVVPWLEYRLHPVGQVTSGLAAYPIGHARDVLRAFRNLAATAADDLTVFAGLLHAPDGSGMPLAAILACHAGALANGAAAFRPLETLGPPLLYTIGPQSYEATNMMLDAGFPRGARNYWKSTFLSELSDEAIDTLISAFADCPSAMSGLVLEHFHGAGARVGATETAFPHRREAFNLLIVSEWLESSEDVRNFAWARRTYEAAGKYAGGGRYVNYLGHDEGEVGEAAFGPNYPRLRALKARYDPTNLFRLNQNVKPGS